MIEIQQLSKSFGSNNVLHDIQLTLSPGKVIGIVGKNGAGKTTLFKCITGLESYKGSIESTWKPLRNHTGFLMTDPFFFPRMTGREYLRLFASARGISITDFAAHNLFDLPLNQYAATYSTGMQKKLALTAILLQKNDFLILDEPFNGVDFQSNMLITGLIKRLAKMGKTILISSHIFSTLRETCDEIHVLESGTFSQKVVKENFDALEQEMMDYSIGNRLQQMNLG